ncbi:serine hydrolase domain-containing protein [Terrilactibacillus sp. S3-3]|nr:serine hydrolase domain-containing protein [Terrilactibacillus sp. S3-3]
MQRVKKTAAVHKALNTVQLGNKQPPKPKGHIHVQSSKQQDIDHYLRSLHFTGTAAVVQNGRIILDKGYGLSNRQTGINNSPQTEYYLGSMTKAFTAAAFMQLEETGKIHTTDTVAKFYPHFPHGRSITLFDLLTHTSGLPTRLEPAVPISRKALVNQIAGLSRHLESKPGTRWHYADTNYDLLGAIIEKVTERSAHESLHTYIKKHIFAPAGMTHSGFGSAMKQTSAPSQGYLKNWRGYYIPVIPAFSQVFACGDIYTTALDLYKFDHALAAGNLVSPSSYDRIFTPRLAHYGFGWYINRKGWSIKPGSYSSHGVLRGWNGSNSFSIDRSTYIVLLSNVGNGIGNYGTVNRAIYTRLEK